MKHRNTNAHMPNQDVAREAAILQNVTLVNNLARRFQCRVPSCVTFDDLASAGMIGLIQAVDRFDVSRGINFRTYAQHRMSGAMLDFLRAEDPLSRSERRRVQRSTATLPATISLDQMPTPALNRLVGIGDGTEPTLAMRSEITRARRCLFARENRVIALLYELGWQTREVAADLRVNESRVSQIKHRALTKLRLELHSVNRARAA